MPNFSESISAPNGYFFARGIKGRSIPGRRKEAVDHKDTHWNGEEPGHTGTAAQLAKPLPPSRAFSSAQVTTLRDRKDTLQVQSAINFTFASQPSVLLTPGELC